MSLHSVRIDIISFVQCHLIVSEQIMINAAANGRFVGRPMGVIKSFAKILLKVCQMVIIVQNGPEFWYFKIFRNEFRLSPSLKVTERPYLKKKKSILLSRKIVTICPGTKFI